ncbi:hypothetical protein ACFV4N_14315 [Actinosynnema sp. NPDC059797]
MPPGALPGVVLGAPPGRPPLGRPPGVPPGVPAAPPPGVVPGAPPGFVPPPPNLGGAVAGAVGVADLGAPAPPGGVPPGDPPTRSGAFTEAPPAGDVPGPVPVDPPPATDGGADVLPDPAGGADEGVGEPDVPPRPDTSALGWMRFIDDAADWSVERAVCAVALVWAPALSAAWAAFSAPPRAVWIARSACCMATWPNTPALPDVALMFSLLATLPRTWSPRPVILPPRFSTASGSIRVPRPPTPPDGDGDGDEGGGLPPRSPPLDEEPEPLRRPTIRRWPAASHRA